MLPRKLGRYELLASLARGGMGEVHLACTRGPGGFERLVVVKCALPAAANDREGMLLAEARIAANLQHTNIVQVHDVGIEDGVV
ncbi:MAG TPA: protein kinase, partial [Kofleriaceae bacterium]|nr:protein kinase [Kofleriaceae bacterium]